MATLTVLGSGPLLDDWVFLDHLAGGRSPWDLFRLDFGANGPVRSWYVDPTAHLAFMRPLSSASFAFDAAYLPPWAWHLQNSAWAIALCLAAGVAYRSIGGTGRWWLLAVVPFTLDDAHAPVWAWAAHRNTLVSLTFAFLALACFIRARTRHDVRFDALAMASLSVGIAGGEMAIVAVVWFVCWAAFREVERAWTLLTTVPYLCLGLGCRLASTAAGFVVDVPGLYIDPIRQPLEFLQQLPARVPLQLASLVLPVWIEATSTLPSVRDHHLALGAMVTLCATALVVWLRADFANSRRARMFGVGMLLCLLPLAAVAPHDRLSLLPGFGFFGMVACLWTDNDWWRSGRARRALVISILCIHFVLGPLLLVPKAQFFTRLMQGFSHAGAHLDETWPSVDGRVYLLRDAGFLNTLLVATQAGLEGRDVEFIQLGRTHSALSVERTDVRTLTLRSAAGRHFFDGPTDHIGRGPLPDRLPGTGFTVVIEERDGSGAPTTVRFAFDRPLEEHTFGVLQHAGLFAVQPPAVGQTFTLPPMEPTSMLLLDDDLPQPAEDPVR